MKEPLAWQDAPYRDQFLTAKEKQCQSGQYETKLPFWKEGLVFKVFLVAP